MNNSQKLYFHCLIFNGLVQSRKILFFVIPAKAGVQKSLRRLDSRLRGNDAKGFAMMAKVLKVNDIDFQITKS
ncbi:MAG: hypothetical protein JRJ86_21935 [Deltaproteobacteria bacterium]|nr:hypothetical protein [Deltaproteobacteria bacterium]MBW2346086.1 hypothetical protein [Deltaproteobacteria bacterium]